MNLTDEQIKSALKDAQSKDKLGIVSMVVGIEEHRLCNKYGASVMKEMNDQRSMTLREFVEQKLDKRHPVRVEMNILHHCRENPLSWYIFDIKRKFLPMLRWSPPYKYKHSRSNSVQENKSKSDE